MDWNTVLLEITLGLQGLAVIGVSLLLIAESYHGRNDHRSGPSRAFRRLNWVTSRRAAREKHFCNKFLPEPEHRATFAEISRSTIALRCTLETPDMFHHQRPRHHPPMPIRDPSSFVLWFLVGLALISLVFTTREAAASSMAQAALAATPSHAVVSKL